MRIVVTGGGTGGHVFPALEVIKEIKRQNALIEVILVGNRNSLEERMAKSAHIQFFGLDTKKMVGQGLLKKLLALVYLKVAFIRSLWFLMKQRPQAVIGVGGYVSAPMIMASYCLGIKRYICEQNVVPGFANKHLAAIANKVFISFEDSRKYFPAGKTVHAGNPVRKEFFALDMKKPHESLNILVTGGSLGARFLNHQVPKVLGQLRSDCPNLQVTHQTGQPMQDEVAHLYQRVGMRAKMVSFIDNMPRAFSEHNLLISRAGATVCAEIMASGMPAILVPYPFANGHQRNNALALVNLGAAIMVEEGKNFARHLASHIQSLYSDPNALKQMAEKAKSMGSSKAAFMIVNSILNDL